MVYSIANIKKMPDKKKRLKMPSRNSYGIQRRLKGLKAK